MLINFTNHPFETWSENQKNDAIKEFNEVIDFAFPQIDPELDEMELEKLVRKYLEEILSKKPSAVHIMGEMNFTFQMIYFLMQNKIPCYASTSERRMEKKGDQIINTFIFKRFRKYRFLDFLFKEDVTKLEGFELTADQKEAYELFQEFIKPESVHRVMILKGYAGTGKTTLLKFFYKYLIEQKMNPLVAAPTNKAKNIILGKLGTTSSVTTIHSLIYTYEKVKETKKDAWTGGEGQIYLNFVNKGLQDGIKRAFQLDPYEDVPEEFISNVVFLFDEASMISSIEDEKIYSTKFGSGSLVNDFFQVFGKELKYIFVGDPCQLPPPNEEKISKALTKEYFEAEHQLSTVEIELTLVKRQSEESGILHIATDLRNKMVNNRLPNYPKFEYKLNYQDVVLCNSSGDIVDRYLEHIEKFGIDNCAIICYRNEQAKEMNMLVKNKLQETSELKVGDILVNNQNSSLYRIDNSERLIVLEIHDRKRNSNFSFLKIRVKVLTTGEIIECYILEDYLQSSNPQLTPEETKSLMISFDNRMKQNNIIRNTMKYNMAQQSDIYLNALKCKYGHAITIHKSQGSEWDYVFMPLTGKDFYLKDRDRESVMQLAKLMYTAVTRARNKVFITDGYWVEGYNARNPENW
jgi:hypothetical protein